MHIHVLGADGSPGVGTRSSCFVIDGRIMIDAGVAVSALAPADARRISHLVLTHAHCDHTLELPFLPFLRDKQTDGPLTIIASQHVISMVRKHIFSPEVWFDLEREQLVKYLPLPSRKPHKVDNYTVMLVPVNHAEGSNAVIVLGENSGIGFTGDTGPTEEFWSVVDKNPRISHVVVDCSYPNLNEQTAIAGKHLTPILVQQELAKLASRGHEIMCLLFHMKPGCREQIERDLKSINLRNAKLLANGDLIEI